MNVRLNFLVRTETRDLFVSLRDRVRLGSITEVLRRALRAYDLITGAISRGAEIIVLEPSGERRRVDFPELPAFRARPRRWLEKLFGRRGREHGAA